MIYLGIDCGTQSTKTVALDGDSGKIIASAAQNYDVLPGLPSGHMEQNPATWVAAVDATVQNVLEGLGGRQKEVAGIGVSGQQHGFVPLDSEARVIRPAKLWCDTSTVEECDLMRKQFGGANYFIERVGLDMLPGFTAPKILWLKRHEPENFRKLSTVLLPHDYLNYQLTGQFRMEYGDASGTALLNVRSRQWEREILEFIDAALPEKMPAVGSSRKPAGTLKRDLAERWGLLPDVVISAGGGDNMMGAIGTANVIPGCVTASIGTSGTIYAYSDKPAVDPKGEIAGFCDSTDAWLPLLCTMNVTVATEAVRSLFGWSVPQLDAAIESAPAGADGILFLPYLQGERTPNLPCGSGVFHGLNTRNMKPALMARAVMEGVTLGMAYGLERMKELGIAPVEIRLTGGGSKSAVWRQICANIFNCPVVTLAESEGAALGAAIQALAAVQTNKSITGWAADVVTTNPSERVEPNKGIAASYAVARQQYVSLTQTLARAAFL
ncbi:MAG TPA: xylulokinase [Candidatus Sulfotelmatobacter sp.]|nr:xylulokinase [Candidatus Sulfotelmatobacter sp.]